MRPFALLLGAAFGAIALTSIRYLNANYEFALSQLESDGPHGGTIAAMLGSVLLALPVIVIGLVLLLPRKTRPSAANFLVALFLAAGVAALADNMDPTIFPGLLGLPASG
ncbi:hypothetical protein [Jannaschia pohangensis]|uniref:Uncharacterized protein n=1 Tax=Jannaschia pohangensis TaxID=390807 RepID=A0A1I3LVM2_9RHOB|nr:hypothetical protein [Jannaschia pohangensis]SFI88814.1 hypothetical protein SAMN04488095_1648 [Jannaschia pohangensis]